MNFIFSSHYRCHEDPDYSKYTSVIQPNRHNCFLKNSKTTTYRKNWSTFQFYIYANNSLGHNYTLFNIDHYDIGKIAKLNLPQKKYVLFYFLLTSLFSISELLHLFDMAKKI